jgi:hypothetical protein
MSLGALYFPYIRPRDDVWLKRASLIWPSISRIVPRSYGVADSSTAAALREAGILKNVTPSRELAEQLQLPLPRTPRRSR